MNSYTIKILVFFLSLFILITISSQIYLAFKDTYKTETAVAYSAAEKIDFKGIYVRNETVINYDGLGVINYPNPDGSKISKGSVVANIFNNESEIINNQNIEKFTQELNMLIKVQNPGTTQVAQPEFLSNLIGEKYQEITSSIEKNDLEDLSSQREEFLSLMNIMNIVTKKETNYNDRITFLQSQITTLTAQQVAPIQTITVDNPGYFVSYTDGYEDKLSLENVDSLSSEQIKSIVNQDTDNKAVNKKSLGKIISGYEWKMIGIIDNSRNYFIQGKNVQLNIASSPETVNATIDEIKETDNPKESIIVLSCDKLTYNLVQHRVERVEMQINNYDGIKVPRKAIRFYHGEKGVYIMLGQEILFRKIDVIFEGDDYVISKNTSEGNYLLLYDDIVIDNINIDDKIIENNNENKDINNNSAGEQNNSSNENIIVGDTQPIVSETSKKGVIKNE